ncbi:hypothetical protein BC941DRAFT_443114 [Chlamydoabsidia padenii]|nr:hypothetical protein BC941DRAFT_443114 [Chlamydoabsidia padenii]
MAPWRLKGVWLGLVHSIKGIHLVLQNPALRQKHHLRVFLQLSILSFMLVGLVRILVDLPLHLLRFVLWTLSPRFLDTVDHLLMTCHTTCHDLVQKCLFALMRHMYPLDDLFMDSLVFVDQNVAHRLAQRKKPSRRPIKVVWKKIRLGVLLCTLTMIPFFGAFVFPVAGALATFKSLGRTQGCVVGICFFCLPPWLTACIIRGLLGMRILVCDLMEPYLSRMGMTQKEKRQWFDHRRDILFGFSVIAYLLIHAVPIFNFLAYGVIQASASYMVLIAYPLPITNTKNI